MNKKTLLLIIFLVIVVCIMPLACVNQKTPAITTITAATVSNPATSLPTANDDNAQKLINTNWTLKSFGETNNMTPAISGTNITLSFNDAGNYHGSDGNDGSYGAAYKAEGNNITFGVTTFAGFEVQDTPPGFANEYKTYFTLLQRAQNFEITGDELTISCTGNNSLLFTRTTN
ncbi:MAG: META domain-containing protein [Dehalococcoidales bacterium]